MPRKSPLGAFIDLVAPLRCPACGGAVLEGNGFCAACEPLLEPAAACDRPPAPAAAVFVYGGPLADAISRLKYHRQADAAPPLGALLAQAASVYAGRIDRVLPMPLHPARLRERGFNQAALLARPVARALGVPLDTSSLRRVRPTADQAGLRRSHRADNVRGAFVAAPRPQAPRVLLIDDVQTTGATLSEAARVLLTAGYGEVLTLALAAASA